MIVSKQKKDSEIVYFIFRFLYINSDSILKYLKLNLFIALIALLLVLVPSIALISFSQSNDSLTQALLSNESSFSSLSRELAQNQTQSDDQTAQDDDN
jgi:hypothetical protein